jgi:Flp pilus assembly protein TadG
MLLKKRSETGAMYALCAVAFLLMVIAICAIAVDMSHFMVVKNELQKTTDAAALAGAQDLFKRPAAVEKSARAVAAMNTADGKVVSEKTRGADVDVAILPEDGNHMRRVAVTAKMPIQHMFAGLFGRHFDDVVARSVAGGSGLLTEMPGRILFPLAVSIDAAPGTYHGSLAAPNSFVAKPINQAKIGDGIVLYLNSQQYKNAAFTSFTEAPASGSYVQNAIEKALGLDFRKDVNFPEVKVGDYIYLNNGIDGERKLAQDPAFSALLAQDALYLPVIAGDPPYNQSRQCLGFIAVKVTGVQNNPTAGVVEQINCILVRGLAPGQGGDLPGTGNTQNDEAIQRLALSPIKLLL